MGLLGPRGRQHECARRLRTLRYGYDEFFPYTRYEANPWYGGHYPTNGNENNYQLIAAGGLSLNAWFSNADGGLVDAPAVWIWNFGASLWDRVGITITATADGTTYAASLAPSDHCSVGGEVRVRFLDGRRQGGEAKDRLSIDLIVLNVSGGQANQPPVATADSYGTLEDMPLVVQAPGVLGNDVDPESDPLTAVLAGGPSSGALTLSADGSFTYTPAPNFTGTDSFTYKANDGHADSNVATVTIEVTAALPAVHVGGITMTISKKGQAYEAQATVLIVDGSGAPVSSATVTGDWLFKGSVIQSGASGSTGGAGTVLLRSPKKSAKSGDIFTFLTSYHL